MSVPLDPLCVQPSAALAEAMRRMDEAAKGILLVVDEERRLVGTLTDGDFRRAILGGVDLKAPVRDLLSRKPPRYAKPITARDVATRGEQMNLMRQHQVRHLPLLDAEGRLTRLAFLDAMEPATREPVRAVVMAGGFGRRLGNLTSDMPKPMLQVGGRPLLQHIVENLRDAGITDISISVHYMPEKITDYFGDGERFGAHIDYIHEDSPRGTAGALALMSPPDRRLLVMNGDILTRVDFQSMLDFHRDTKADFTMAVRQYDVTVPYGVVDVKGDDIVALREKPSFNFFVNAGIYLIEPSVHSLIPTSQRFDMTDLANSLIDRGRRVVSFPVREYWLDIGQPEDYVKANEDIKDGGPVS